MNLGDVPLRGTGQLGPKPMKAGSTMEAIIVYRQAADIVSYNAIDNERELADVMYPVPKRCCQVGICQLSISRIRLW
jgi:hypothetical protein